ncbi:hypothetical protein [Vibrio zhugei]|nr:hypothetical protein [Vibrio zhugei]
MKFVIFVIKYGIGLGGLFFGSATLDYLPSLIYQLILELGMF